MDGLGGTRWAEAGGQAETKQSCPPSLCHVVEDEELDGVERDGRCGRRRASGLAARRRVAFGYPLD